MKNIEVFRPKGNLAWGITALVLDAVYLAQSFVYPGGNSNLVFDISVGAVVASIAYLLWLRPKLVLRAEEFDVVNPIRKVTIRYRDVTHLDTKWALQVRHGEKTTVVWVAPANGKQRWVADNSYRWFYNRGGDTEPTKGLTSMSRSLNSDSGIAAHLLQSRIDGLH